VARFFTSRVVYTLGLLSYSIYLLHWRFVGVPGFLGSKLAAWGEMGQAVGVAVAFAATIGMAALTYRFIEKPSRNAIRGFTTRRSDRAAARAEATIAPNS
jgi:peptidoglycan/LPS O-acetylase OafA/YrhL